MNKEISDKLRFIAAYYGIRNQLMQTMEECAELTQACSKFIRKNNITSQTDIVIEKDPVPQFMKAVWNDATYDNLIEEVADVEIMLEHLKSMLNIDEKELNELENYKANRQLKRIEQKDEIKLS